MGADEAGVIRALKAHPPLILAMTTEHGWRIIDTAAMGTSPSVG
jgi:hypothetical protein